MRHIATVLLTLMLAFVSQAALAQAVRLAGDVIAVEGNMLKLKPTFGADGAALLADNVRVNVRFPVDPTRVVPGAYVGALSIPQADGTLRVTALQVFPEASRGLAEGHGPMATDPGSTMTNATVSAVGGANTPTSAAVQSVTGDAAGQRVTVTYKGGEQVLVVPPGTPVYSSAPGDRSLLVPGAHVVVFGRRNADGVVVAERLSVGKDGYVPPL